VARVCLDMLRSRKSRKEESLEEQLLEAPENPRQANPAEEAILADSVGSALLIVLRTLTPAERVAFVLHDLFDLSFEEIAPIVGRSEAAARQLASRARRRVRGGQEGREDEAKKREIVSAFLAASRGDDFEGLLALLDPAVVLRADAGDGPLGPSRLITGAPEVAAQAHRFAGLARFAHPVLVNGTPGFLVAPDGQPLAVIGIAVRDDKITEIDILADPERLSQLDLTGLIN